MNKQEATVLLEDNSMNPITDENFWDCECEENYIHPKVQRMCVRCGYYHYEMPDSRVYELLDAGYYD